MAGSSATDSTRVEEKRVNKERVEYSESAAYAYLCQHLRFLSSSSAHPDIELSCKHRIIPSRIWDIHHDGIISRPETDADPPIGCSESRSLFPDPIFPHIALAPDSDRIIA